jgi:gamma-glutamylcyclotransferase (GGCT)/AIG2-like uncharacterized protein YtfP
MEKIFSYGTLQDPQIQQKLLQRTLESTPDSIQGFTLSEVYSTDGMYPILIPEAESTTLIQGAVLSITTDELVAFDEYEGQEYQRSLLTLQSGNQAWVYHQ